MELNSLETKLGLPNKPGLPGKPALRNQPQIFAVAEITEYFPNSLFLNIIGYFAD